MQISVRNPAQIGNAILRYRTAKALTQSALGTDAGLNQKIISSVENGAPGTRLETLCKLLAALDLELVIKPKQNS